MHVQQTCVRRAKCACKMFAHEHAHKTQQRNTHTARITHTKDAHKERTLSTHTKHACAHAHKTFTRTQSTRTDTKHAHTNANAHAQAHAHAHKTSMLFFSLPGRCGCGHMLSAGIQKTLQRRLLNYSSTTFGATIMYAFSSFLRYSPYCIL